MCKQMMQKKVRIEPKKSTKKYCLAFIDLLGTTNNIYADNDDDFLNIIHTCYSNAIKIAKELMPEVCVPDVSVKIFSDNIVVAIPCEPRGDKDQYVLVAIASVIILSASLQEEFLKHNILLRGGMTCGELYIDDVLVMGPALIRAYELESETAKNPRIVLSKGLVELIYGFDNDDDKLPQNILEHLNKDKDEQYYINYLFQCKEIDFCYSSLEYFEKLNGIEQNSRIKTKYEWHIKFLSAYIAKISLLPVDIMMRGQITDND
jgi:hypothetical protein